VKGLSVHQIGFLLIVLAVSVIGVLFSVWRETPAYAVLTFMFVGFVLVNVPRWVRADLTNAGRRLAMGDFADARRLSQKFLDRMRRRPWLRPIAGIEFVRDAPPVEVIALSILAQAQMGLGDLQDAHESLEMALSMDAADALRLPNEGDISVEMLNDDKTSMEFVVDVLETSFGLSRLDAVRVMLTIHLEGRARVGAFERAKAEALTAQAVASAREQGFPLQLELVGIPAA
jgi:ATP-dependent Clp protease adaptor protein ClpS